MKEVEYIRFCKRFASACSRQGSMGAPQGGARGVDVVDMKLETVSWSRLLVPNLIPPPYLEFLTKSCLLPSSLPSHLSLVNHVSTTAGSLQGLQDASGLSIRRPLPFLSRSRFCVLVAGVIIAGLAIASIVPSSQPFANSSPSISSYSQDGSRWRTARCLSLLLDQWGMLEGSGLLLPTHQTTRRVWLFRAARSWCASPPPNGPEQRATQCVSVLLVYWGMREGLRVFLSPRQASRRARACRTTDTRRIPIFRTA